MTKLEPRIASATHGIRHVFIRNLELPAHIGVYRNEEGRTQRVRINLDLATDETGDAQDMLENVVDYHVIEKRIRAIISEGHVRLAETLAEEGMRGQGWSEERALNLARLVLLDNPRRMFGREPADGCATA